LAPVLPSTGFDFDGEGFSRCHNKMFIKKTNQISKESGFSLIELIIILLIIAIVSVAAIPQIQQSMRLYRVESAAGLLSNRLNEARLSAIKHNRAAWLEINTTDRMLEVWTTNNNNQPINTTVKVPIPSDVSIVAGSPSRVTFNSLGRNQANANAVIKFRLTNTNFCKSVSISAVGNITMAAC
jgi:Tfp pilus assembly protein FimT